MRSIGVNLLVEQCVLFVCVFRKWPGGALNEHAP